MATLGVVEQLKPSEVSLTAIDLLRERITNPPTHFPFDCKLCGAERRGNFIDPGLLMVMDLTCAQASDTTVCKRPATPRTTRRPHYFLPGSLVLAPIDEDDRPWPAIVEDCPYGTDRFVISGKTPGTVKAYFVTFIFADNATRGFSGGYIDNKKLIPYLPVEEFPLSCTVAYRESLELCNLVFLYHLVDRLKRLSFVAHVANLKQIDLGSPPESVLRTNYAETLHRAAGIMCRRGRRGDDDDDGAGPSGGGDRSKRRRT